MKEWNNLSNIKEISDNLGKGMVVNVFLEGITALYWMKYILIITSVLVSSLLCTRYDRDCYNKTFKKVP